MVAFLITLLLASAASVDPKQITDVQIVVADTKPFDKRAKMGRQEVLGLNRGMTVLAEYPCSDLCPAYTRRIIRYDRMPGPGCENAGGVTRRRWIPVSIAISQVTYCVPAVIGGEDVGLPRTN